MVQKYQSRNRTRDTDVQYVNFFLKNFQRNKKNLTNGFHEVMVGGVRGGKPVKHVKRHNVYTVYPVYPVITGVPHVPSVPYVAKTCTPPNHP